MRLTPSHFHILLSVAQQPSHGYAIKQEVEKRTAGRIQLGPGSLYWAIKKLADAGLLAETDGSSQASDGPSRRYYMLTPSGRERLQSEVEILADIVRLAESQGLLQPAEG